MRSSAIVLSAANHAWLAGQGATYLINVRFVGVVGYR